MKTNVLDAGFFEEVVETDGKNTKKPIVEDHSHITDKVRGVARNICILITREEYVPFVATFYHNVDMIVIEVLQKKSNYATEKNVLGGGDKIAKSSQNYVVTKL